MRRAAAAGRKLGPRLEAAHRAHGRVDGVRVFAVAVVVGGGGVFAFGSTTEIGDVGDVVVGFRRGVGDRGTFFLLEEPLDADAGDGRRRVQNAAGCAARRGDWDAGTREPTGTRGGRDDGEWRRCAVLQC